MICPMMSRMIADKMTGDEPSVCISKLELIDCQKENCALWVKDTTVKVGDWKVVDEIIPAHCGLIQRKED